MVGGKVINTMQKADSMALVVRGTGNESNDVIHVDVPHGSDIVNGDSVWWQSGTVYVTRPGNRFEPVFSDREVKKIGYSYGHYHLTPA